MAKKPKSLTKAAVAAAICGMIAGSVTLVGCGEASKTTVEGSKSGTAATGDKNSCKGPNGCDAKTSAKTTTAATTK
jgi:hypothetical protein